jgi:flavin reductase (DIM6/NTAB) family NADH-FMN oxidoreductase RutF
MFRSGSGEGGSRKDSARNAIETGEFVANVVTESLAEQMDRTSENLPPDESEFEFAEVESAESVTVNPPRVANAVANLECTLYDSLEVYDSHMVIGTVDYFHISEDIMENGKVQMEKIDTVGRLGGPYYTGIDPLELRRRSL